MKPTIIDDYADEVKKRLSEEFCKNMDNKERENWIVPDEIEEIIDTITNKFNKIYSQSLNNVGKSEVQSPIKTGSSDTLRGNEKCANCGYIKELHSLDNYCPKRGFSIDKFKLKGSGEE